MQSDHQKFCRMQPTIYLASDSLGCELISHLKLHLQEKHPSYKIEDLGNFDKYYEAALKVGGLVQQSRAAGGQDRAVLTCGSGMGMAIISNKFPNVYAAVVESVQAAGNAAGINNANILTLGGNVFKVEDAMAAVDKWLSTSFTEGFDQYKDLLDTSMLEIPRMVDEAVRPWYTSKQQQ